MDNARIVVVRDVTERYRRFEAERRNAESLARQQDAQAINRFTRHEVKMASW
jgi:phage terminase small subunit